MIAGGSDARLGCKYQREAWKMAKDVKKLRKALEKLRYCDTSEPCAKCKISRAGGPCHERRLALVDAVLAATAKKPRG